ncbi:MAG: recombination protein RecR [Vampirovibrio sp.]
MSTSFIAPLTELIEAFQQLPGVGPKTAQRYAFYMLQASEAKTQRLITSLQDAKTQVRICSQCHQWSVVSPCELCSEDDTHRRATLLCVVQAPQDVYALERTQAFKGQYHVLGGILSPMEGVGPEALNIRTLLDRVHALVERHGPDAIEVVFALPPSTQGEMTSLYMARQLKPYGIKVTRIAYGLPVGGDLDYADQLTLSRALEGRQMLS